LLKFKGISNYLEVLLAWIDAPQLSTLYITFTSRIASGTPQLIEFTHRMPKLKALEKARVFFDNAFATKIARVNLSSQTSGYRDLNVGFICRKSDRLLSSLEQVFTPSLPPLSTLEDLYIYEGSLDWQRNFENMPWPELLHPFTAVKNLYLSKNFARHIVPALQKLVGGRSTEVLPSLENIFLERLEPSGPVQEGIGHFIAARQATGHAITITCWERQEQIEDYNDNEDDDDDLDDDDDDLDDDDDDEDGDLDDDDYDKYGYDDDIDEDDEEDLYDDDETNHYFSAMDD
jgi:hypothetical protein